MPEISLQKFRKGDRVIISVHLLTHNYKRPPAGTNGIVRAYMKNNCGEDYCMLDVADGGVYISELELYNQEWDT